ncbi:MAG: hypothetical protein ACRENE_35245, partial [Polyangiaceae bacterium]
RKVVYTSSPQPNRPRESASLVIRFGTVAGVGTAGALACSLPAALRLLPGLGEAESPGHVWLALASAALLPMMAAVVVLGLAREGSRAFGGEGAAFAYGVSMWLVLLVVGLSVFGRLLRATTHHHALAGVTFALGGLGLALGTAVVCARVVTILRSAPAWPRRVLSAALTVSLGAALLMVALGCARASWHDPSSAAEVGTLVDVFAFVVSAGYAARSATVVRRIFALVGPPSVVVVLAVGLPALRWEPLREAMRDRAPVLEVAAQLVAHHR